MKKEWKKLVSESGAIMLEVVAVLSLMGLMGTMLFRQIYLRNQELHNIQMASEIRLVKEAFAAWIQARHSQLPAICPKPDSYDRVHSCNVSDAHIMQISQFLPEGYFVDDNEVRADKEDVLRENYTLKLVSYWRGLEDEAILTYYGVVVPSLDILPDKGEETTTWNFRRAARVAMLIGVDGGAYDPRITGDSIVGAVGTWSLPIGDADAAYDDSGTNQPLLDEQDKPLYVAITGIDVFQPEIEVPDLGGWGLPDPWNLATQNSVAYGYFVAGGAAHCYTPGPRDATLDPDGVFRLRPDTLTNPEDEATCRPAFYVAGDYDTTNNRATGDVYVSNDLRVGHDYGDGKSAIRFDNDGMIVFEKTPVNDPQNGNQQINYMLDPQYTSVMNDIKVMSRGGAKLSEILPNYILKSQSVRTCEIRKNNQKCTNDASADLRGIKVTCPKQYKAAILVQPIQFGANMVSHGDTPDTGYAPNKVLVKKSQSINTSAESPADPHGHTVTVPQLELERRRLYVELSDADVAGTPLDADPVPAVGGANTSHSFNITMGYRKADNTPVNADVDEDIKFILQTYCVFDSAAMPSPSPTAERDAAGVAGAKTEIECRTLGGTWNSTVSPSCTK